MKKVLLCYAHCDDELIWGFPWLLDKSLECRVLICSSDEKNPERQQYRRGREALTAICEVLDVSEVRVLTDFHSDFYRLPARGKGPLLGDWWDAAQSALREMSEGCDLIACHNEFGEYGNCNHILVHRMVTESGLRIRRAWTTASHRTSTWPLGDLDYPPTENLPQAVLDQERFDFLKLAYVQRNAWTWDFPVPSPVGIVETWR